MNRTKIRTMRKFPPQNISSLNISIGTCLTCPCLQGELEEDGGQCYRLYKAAVRIRVEGPEEIDQLRAFRTSGGVSRVCRCVCNQYKQIHANTSTYMQIHANTNIYKQIQLHTCKYKYIQAHTSIYKHIQVHTCKYKYIQANTSNANNRHQYWYVFGCIRLYLYVLYLFLYVFVCIINNIDFFESDAMGTTRVGTGGNLNAGKCILTVFGKRSTAAGGPTYRVSALTCFFQLGLSCDTLALPPVSQSRWVHAP